MDLLVTAITVIELAIAGVVVIWTAYAARRVRADIEEAESIRDACQSISESSSVLSSSASIMGKAVRDSSASMLEAAIKISRPVDRLALAYDELIKSVAESSKLSSDSVNRSIEAINAANSLRAVLEHLAQLSDGYREGITTAQLREKMTGVPTYESQEVDNFSAFGRTPSELG